MQYYTYFGGRLVLLAAVIGGLLYLGGLLRADLLYLLTFTGFVYLVEVDSSLGTEPPQLLKWVLRLGLLVAIALILSRLLSPV